MVIDLPKFAVEGAKLLMKRWLESLRDNEQGVTWLSRALGVFAIIFFIVLAYNYGATENLTRYALPSWLYFLFGLPSLALLLVFAGLQRVAKKYEPPPVLEKLEPEHPTKKAPISDFKRDNELALAAEIFIFGLLSEHGIAVTKSPMSPMAQDMAGAFYTFERPLVLAEDFVFPDNHVLDIQYDTRERTIVVTKFTISSVFLHTYATFVVKPKS
jgi:hypothetical protein